MNPEQENLQALRRLLVLKRHEQPPPGYFGSFSNQVMARIQAGERAPDSLWERFSFNVPWLQELWTAFETKPILAGAFGATVCGLIATGFLFSDRSSNVESAPITFLSNGNKPAVVVQAATPAAGAFFGQAPGLDVSTSGTVDPVQLKPSLFEQVKRPEARLVTFTLPGSN